jgi:hypothetical protein
MVAVSAATNILTTFLYGTVAGAVNFLFTMTQNMTRWSNEEDELLIDFVKNHEMLYNVKSQVEIICF